MNNIIEELLTKAKDFHNNKENLKAEKLYKQVIEKQPHNFEAHNFLGILYCQSNKFLEGLTCFNKAIEINNNHAGLFCNRGNAFFELNKFNEAIANYDIAISLQPKLLDAYYNKGNALGKLLRFDESINNYDNVIKLNPNLYGAYINKGNALKNINKLNEAITNYDKAIQIKPDATDAYWNKAITLLLKGELEKGYLTHSSLDGYAKTVDMVSLYANKQETSNDLAKCAKTSDLVRAFAISI